MSLLAPIVHDEAEALFNTLMNGLAIVNDELELLGRREPATRELLYGPRALEAMQGVRDDLVDLLCDTAAALSGAAT
jgi:hypothetical protein